MITSIVQRNPLTTVAVNTAPIHLTTIGRLGGQIAYSTLSGLPTLGTAAATAATDYAPAANGVTNGNSHDHSGGDGGQIAYANLSGLPTLGTAAATDITDYAPAANGVTNGDSHDHSGGDGAQIAYANLSGLPTLTKLTEIVSVSDYGAVGDGVADDATAIQNTINAVVSAGGGKVHLPAGNYKINTGLSWTGDGVWLAGDGEGATTITCTFATGDIITIGNGSAIPEDCVISDLSITSSVSRSSGSAVRFRDGHNLKAYNIRLKANMFDGFVFDGGSDQFLYYLENFEINSGNYGIFCGSDGTLMQELFVNNGIIANCSAAGILLANASGQYFTNVSILECASGVVTYPVADKRAKAAFFTNVIVDSCTSSGWKLFEGGGTVSDITLNACWGSSCGSSSSDNGLYIAQGSGKISGVVINASTFVNNEGNGILLEGGVTDCTISDCNVLSNSQAGSGAKHGIEIGADVSQFNISGGTCGLGGEFATNNQAYGININTGSSDYYTITGVNVLGNVTGGIADSGSGTNKHLYGNYGYRTSNAGTATVANGNSSVSSNHGLAVTPAVSDILLTPTADPSERYWVSATTSTQFTITLSGAASGDKTFGWSARVKGA